MSGTWPKEKERHGIILKPEGIALLEQTIEEERKVNPEGVAQVEAMLGSLRSEPTRWPEDAEL